MWHREAEVVAEQAGAALHSHVVGKNWEGHLGSKRPQLQHQEDKSEYIVTEKKQWGLQWQKELRFLENYA